MVITPAICIIRFTLTCLVVIVSFTSRIWIKHKCFGDSVAVFQTISAAKKAGSTANVIYESKTGNFWYNEDGDSALVGALLFANAKGIPDSYWVAAGVM